MLIEYDWKASEIRLSRWVHESLQWVFGVVALTNRQK